MTASGWRSVAAGLAVALVLALAGLGYVLASGDDKADQALALIRAERAATKAARTAAVHLTTYQYTSLSTDFTWADTAGTKAFGKKYALVVVPIKKYVAGLKVRAKGTVDKVAATAKDADHVTVLLFVDQALSSGTTGERKLVTPRITMQMVRSGGRWLVADASLRNLDNS